MKSKTYQKFRILIMSFVSVLIAIAIINHNTYLAFSAVVVGMIFLVSVKTRMKEVVEDERTVSVGNQAARWSFNILIGVLASLSIMFTSRSQPPETDYIESLGVILSYIVLFALAVYAMTFKYLNNRYGGRNDK